MQPHIGPLHRLSADPVSLAALSKAHRIEISDAVLSSSLHPSIELMDAAENGKLKVYMQSYIRLLSTGQYRIYENMKAKPKKAKRRGGRPKLYAVRILLSLPAETLASIDRLLEPRETRLDFIRAAIAVEVKRRKK